MDKQLDFQVFETSAIDYGAVYILLLFTIIPFLISIFCYKAYLRKTWGFTLLISVTTMFMVYIAIAWGVWSYESHHKIPTDPMFSFHIIPAGALFFFLVPLAIQLYGKWFCNQATEAEKIPGWTGFKAWLSLGNLICCAGIVICGYLMSYPYHTGGRLFELSILIFPLLWIYPLVNTLSFYFSQNGQNKDNLSAVQTKIIKMLEEGKITPQECTELLAAIYKSQETKNADDPAVPMQGTSIPPKSPALTGERNE